MSKLRCNSKLARPIMGDLVLLALFAARTHPSSQIRAAIFKAYDSALDALGAASCSERKLKKALLDAKGPSLVPMVATSEDIAVVRRVWRSCALADALPLFIGSADAVGEGQGALLDQDLCAIYQPREARVSTKWIRRVQTEEAAANAINLGMLPRSIAPFETKSEHGAFFEIDAKAGVTLNVPSGKPATGPIEVATHSWICDRAAAGVQAASLKSLNALGLSVKLKRGVVIIRADTPEAAIRFSTACVSRRILCVREEDSAASMKDCSLIELAPPKQPSPALPLQRHSGSGPLADWIRVPPFPVVLELDLNVRQELMRFANEQRPECE